MAFPPTLRRRFEPVRELGAGALGRVWLARPLDRPGAPPLAVKVLREELLGDAAFRARFTREVEAARRIRHPRVVPLVDGGFAEGTPFMATPFFPGGSLRAALAAGPLEPARVRSLAAQVLEGLAALHRAGLVHRDVKPENLLLDQDGGAVVADLGLAQGGGLTAVTATGIIMGTPGFMAPEVCRGEPAGPAADLYALGCVIHEMATGEEVWAGDPGAVFKEKALDGRLPNRARIPDAGLEALVEGLLAPDPAARPGAGRVAEALAGTWRPDPQAASRAGARTMLSQVERRAPDPDATGPHRPAGRLGAWAPGLALVLGLALGRGMGRAPEAGPGPPVPDPGPVGEAGALGLPTRLPPELYPLMRLRERARVAASSLAEEMGPNRRQLSLMDLGCWDPGDAFLAPVGYFKVRWGTKAEVVDTSDQEVRGAVEGLLAEGEPLLGIARAWLETVLGAARPDAASLADAAGLVEASRALLFALPDDARERIFPAAPGDDPSAARLAALAVARWMEEHPWTLGPKAAPDLREKRQAVAREVGRQLERLPDPVEGAGLWIPYLDAYAQVVCREGRDQAAAQVRLRPALDAALDQGRTREAVWLGACLATALGLDPGLAGSLDRRDPERLERVRARIEEGLAGEPEAEALVGLVRAAGEALADPGSAAQRASATFSLLKPGGLDGLLDRGLVDQGESEESLLALLRRDPGAQPTQPELGPQDPLRERLPPRLAEALPRYYPAGVDPRKRYRLAAAALDAEPMPAERTGPATGAFGPDPGRRPTLLQHLLRLRLLCLRGAELASADPVFLRREAGRALAWTSAASWPRERVVAELWSIRGELAPGGSPTRAAELARACLDRLWIGREGHGYLAYRPLAVQVGVELGNAIDRGAVREDADRHRRWISRADAGSGP